MKNTLTSGIILSFLSFFVFSSASAKDPFHVDIDITLKRLDSLIISNDDYVRNKKILLKELKSKANSGTPEEIYWKNKNVYNEYKTFDSDSALVWLNKLDELSENLNNKDEIINNKIERSFILAATGLLLESLKTAEEINTCHLSLNGKKKYYNQMSYLYSHLHQYAVSSTLNDHPIQVSRGSYYQLKQLNYIDSIQMCTLPTDEDYMWNMAWKYRETDSLTYYRELLEKKLSGRSFNQRNDAMLLYALSHLYAQEDDRTGMINALAYSAMADIRCANREIASLQELSRHLFEHDDIDRAYSYISLCLKNAQIYKARSRAIDIANVMDTLYDMNMARNAERESKLKQSLIGLLIITIFACFAIAIIAIQFMRLRKSNRALSTSNTLLNENIDELTLTKDEFKRVNAKLKQLNADMNEANKVKEEYIGYVFNICSSYLGKMEESQKLINRKLKTGQLEDLHNITSSATMINQEMKEFYQNFDAVFLNLYPDFVDEFNALLKPEDRIILKTNELLNTELRIYALVRLGISDSAKIAEFLHISPQTVYNNRVKVRNKAVVPKDEFASVVRKLGNINLELS